MYIITVIPIQKNNQKEYLSYFSAEDIPLGYIVTVPVRLKEIDAIVINVEEVSDLKSDIKNADFQMKKISKIKGESPFSKSFFVACQRLKTYTISSTGSIIKSLLPSTFIENLNSLEKTDKETKQTADKIRHEKLIFQATPQDRLAFYRTLIREAFAKKESVFLCVPTRYDIDILSSELSRGVEQYVFPLYSDLPQKTIIKTYNSVMTEMHPILIIATGTFLCLPRSDIKTIIIENESSDVYKQMTRPYIDIRSFAEILSSIQKTKLIFGDTLLRPETLYRHELGELGEISSPLYRLNQTENQKVIDMKEEMEASSKKIFSVISKETITAIDKSLNKKESVFLFAARKGLAPITVCNDCGNTLLCPSCSTPIVLYGTKQVTANKSTTQRIFMCNKCGRKETSEISCPRCSSWNLTPLGIGTDRVYEEIKKIYPNIKIFQIDKESAKTANEAKNLINNFEKTHGSILIGTEMAFYYIRKSLHCSAIISLDGLFSIPSFNMTQKIIHLIDKLQSITTNELIIQTRIPDNKTLQHILSGNVLPLCREDLVERKKFGYPPFKRLIKITFDGTAGETEKARILIEKTLHDYEPQIFSAFLSKNKGQYVTNTVIKVDPKDWPLPVDDKLLPNKKLAEYLHELPPSFSINIDPEDLL